MTLLELLVKELPSRGGWPDGAAECERYRNQATIDFYDKHGNWEEDCCELYGAIAAQLVTDGHGAESVTREQYEAATQPPVWDGKGLPPVGVECEWQDKNTKKWFPVRVVYSSEWVTVIKEDKEDYAVELAIENYGDDKCRNFRPIRTEAERKREKVIQAMVKSWQARADEEDDGQLKSIYEIIYDAIAAGKIPGVQLTKGGE